MAAPKRTPFEREHDLLEVSRLYLQGKTQVNIAAQLGFSQQQISYDLNILRKRWLKSSLVNIDEAKAKELAKIDQLELEYWDAWDRSKQDAESIMQEKQGTVEDALGKIIGTRVREVKRREGQSGNSAYLSGIQWCINKRCEILGLNFNERSQSDWRAEIIELLKSGRITPELVIEELGNNLATELFISAGISVTSSREDQK